VLVLWEEERTTATVQVFHPLPRQCCRLLLRRLLLLPHSLESVGLESVGQCDEEAGRVSQGVKKASVERSILLEG
jgi:hypothetical protein